MYEILDSNSGERYPIELLKLKRIPLKGELITIETVDKIKIFEVLNFNSVFSRNNDPKLVILVKLSK